MNNDAKEFDQKVEIEFDILDHVRNYIYDINDNIFEGENRDVLDFLENVDGVVITKEIESKLGEILEDTIEHYSIRIVMKLVDLYDLRGCQSIVDKH